MSPELWGRVRYQPRRPSIAHTVVIVCDPCQLSGQFEHLTKSCGRWLGSMSFCRVPPAWLSCFKPLSVWQYRCMDEPSLGRAGRGSKESWRIPGRGAQASLWEARGEGPCASTSWCRMEACSFASSVVLQFCPAGSFPRGQISQISARKIL